MVFNRLVFRVHAIQRMYERHISEEEVRQTIAAGEVMVVVCAVRFAAAESMKRSSSVSIHPY